MLSVNRITFPGLNLDFNIDPIAFSIGNISVRWYGIILCTGIIAAFLYFMRRASKTESIDPDHVYNITLLAVIIGIIGARFTYVITNLEDYDTFWEMINITQGGIAIYGAIIFGLVSVLIYCRIRKLNAYSILDSISPAVMLGQIIGRWGNFVNAEAYGYSEGINNLPWRMGVDRVEIDGVLDYTIEYVHPTFFYESLWNLIGFLIINFVYRKKKFDGQIFYLYILWYGLGRGFIEMLRTDSLRVFGFKLSVIIGFASFIIAVIMLFVRAKKSEKELAEATSYTNKYDALRVVANKDEKVEAVPFDNTENDEEIDEDSSEDKEALEEQDTLDGEKDDDDDEDDDEDDDSDGE